MEKKHNYSGTSFGESFDNLLTHLAKRVDDWNEGFKAYQGNVAKREKSGELVSRDRDGDGEPCLGYDEFESLEVPVPRSYPNVAGAEQVNDLKTEIAMLKGPYHD
jgi:hypothetical protein